MITPAEIETKEFSRAVRGYKMEEVDEFLDEIILDMEKLLEENKILTETVEELGRIACGGLSPDLTALIMTFAALVLSPHPCMTESSRFLIFTFRFPDVC